MRANCQINSSATAPTKKRPATNGHISSLSCAPLPTKWSYVFKTVTNPSTQDTATAQNMPAIFERGVLGASAPVGTLRLSPQRLQKLVFCVYSKPQDGQNIFSSVVSLEYFPAFTLLAMSEFSPLLAGRVLSRRFNLPGAFFDENDLARRHVIQGVDHAARPSRFDRLRLRRLAEAEMDAHVVLRVVAAAAANLVDPRPAVGFNLDPRANAVTVRFRADEFDRNPVVIRRRIRPQQNRKIVDRVDHDVDVAIVVEIAERASATGSRFDKRPADLLGDVFERALTLVLIEDFALRVAGLGGQLLDFGVDVAVDQEDVEPAVVVEIHEPAAPAEEARIDADAGGEGHVVEAQAGRLHAKVAVERRGVAGEVGLEDVEQPVAVVIADAHAHSGLRLSVTAVSRARLDADVGERPVFVVVVERGGGRIVSDINVGPGVVVEIRRDDSESVRAVGLQNARLVRNVRERDVAPFFRIVAVEDVLAAFQPGRAAGDHHAFVQTRPGLWRGRGLEVEVDVIGDEEVEVAVLVVIDEGRAAPPSGLQARHADLLRYVREHALAVVFIKRVPAVVRNEKVVEAVVVVIADADRLPPPRASQPRLFGHVGESPVTVVAVETICRLLPFRKAAEARPVDEEEVEPAVVVVIEPGDTAAGRFQQVFVLALVAVDGLMRDPCRARDIRELHAVAVIRASGDDFAAGDFAAPPRRRQTDQRHSRDQKSSARRMLRCLAQTSHDRDNIISAPANPQIVGRSFQRLIRHPPPLAHTNRRVTTTPRNSNIPSIAIDA